VGGAVAEIRLKDALHAARRSHASDLHLCASLPPVVRIDGHLERLPGSALLMEELDAIANAIAVARGGTLERQGEFSAAWHDADAGLIRVHVFRAAGAPSIAFRFLRDGTPDLDALAVPAAVAKFAERDHGLVLFAGPTGSGKSTTMAAMVARINQTFARRIITLEDPIEYRHESVRSVVSQRQVGVDTPSLAQALRGALRSDPDVIVIGEMRDAESIAGALTAAETGHLVLATLHTSDAGKTIDRIVDAFTSGSRDQVRMQLARVLAAVVCQQLVRRSGGGRLAAFEVLVATDAVRTLIREAKVHQLKNAIATGRQFGMQTLESHLSALIASGDVEAEEGKRFSLDAALESNEAE
jgi:twitching motility protein PilT